MKSFINFCKKFCFCSLLITFIGGNSACAQDISWPATKKLVRTTFPDVQQMSADSLMTLMDDPRSNPVFLMDARKKEEYVVSHLLGAEQIDPDHPDLSLLEGLDKDTPIVLYCSVGYRSSQVAQQVMKAGFTNVYNLEGSIFEWANAGYPTYRDGMPVQEVHPYDKVWGKLLKKELRTYKLKAGQ